MNRRDLRVVLGLAPAGYGVATGLQGLAAGKLFLTPQDAGSWIEVLGFLTGLQYVYLVIRQNRWAWPIGFVNAGIYAYLYFKVFVHLANGGLQLFYMAAMIHGWWSWKQGSDGQDRHIRWAGSKEIALGSLFVALFSVGWYPVLVHFGGQVPVWDALTTGLCLLAQFWTNQKVFQNWPVWILANAIYVPLYIYRGFYPTAALYAILLGMAVWGMSQWRRDGA